MTTESIFTKRRARYKGEMGILADDPSAEEDLQPFTEGDQIYIRYFSQKNVQALRYLWGLVHKAFRNTDRYVSKRKLMDDLLVQVDYSKLAYNSETKKLERVPKSLAVISNEELRLATERIMDVICTELIPGMKKNDLRREIEEMVGIRRTA